MRILFDTHVYFWWVTDDPKLPQRVRVRLEDQENELIVSAVVPWELATKTRIGKWPSALRALDEMDEIVAANGVLPLPVSLAHARLAGLLPGDHRDPFDRLLAAQAEIESVPLVTADPAFREFGTKILW